MYDAHHMDALGVSVPTFVYQWQTSVAQVPKDKDECLWKSTYQPGPYLQPSQWRYRF